MRAVRLWSIAALTLVVGACERSGDRITGAPRLSADASGTQNIGINVVLRAAPTAAQLAKLGAYGTVSGTLPEINAVLLRASADQLPAIRALPYVVAANPDAERKGAPVDAVSVSDFAGGLNTWDQDAINVTNFRVGRTIAFDGSGVYVGVLDTGLLDSWRQYFPEQRIATQFAKAFSGGGQNQGEVSEPPNQWEHDQNSHGTHVTSTILGYSLLGTSINGTAPLATVIPVKVLNQAGFGWSSMIAAGILHVANLKASGALAGSPVVINMSLGGPALDAVEKAAIDLAIARGVIIVASAGNEGEAGMGYPGAYAPVISVAASGWIGEWQPLGNNSWWVNRDVLETGADNFYVTDFSSRQKAGQDLDIAAPGSWVVGPFQLQSGNISYFFLGGTSMSSPHVAGIAALMLQKNAGLLQAKVESILERTAIRLPAGCRLVRPLPGVAAQEICWGDDATGAGLVRADKALAATP
ncbi:MAG TPA: S8 family serine peptidase [Gemmatimonadales bacterium]|nr:S8 family serine peptidase [Gemmatimonadales bacterium]